MFEGVLQKMHSEWLSPIRYYLNLGDDFLIMNTLLGKEIVIKHIGYECLNCGGQTPVFRQGFCKSCFFTSAKVGDWIIHPQLSKAHLGIEDRNLEYEKSVQLKPHVVYLSNTGKAKVGVTRKTQLPVRWIDQGACQALVIAQVPNRYLAGITEVALKPFISDKTYWKTMLSQTENIDLIQIKNDLIKHFPAQVASYFSSDEQVQEFLYPVIEYPSHLIRLNLDNQNEYKGTLIGVKGQYLIFSDGKVFNVRNFEGYKVRIFIN